MIHTVGLVSHNLVNFLNEKSAYPEIATFSSLSCIQKIGELFIPKHPTGRFVLITGIFILSMAAADPENRCISGCQYAKEACSAISTRNAILQYEEARGYIHTFWSNPEDCYETFIACLQRCSKL